MYAILTIAYGHIKLRTHTHTHTHIQIYDIFEYVSYIIYTQNIINNYNKRIPWPYELNFIVTSMKAKPTRYKNRNNF